MDLRRTSLVLCILFIFHLQQTFPSVSSRPSSVVPNHKTLPSNADAVWSERIARELAVVIKRGGGGGRGGGSSSRGGRQSRSSGVGRVIPVHGGGGSHRSSSSRNLQGPKYVVGWLGMSILAGLILV